MTRAICPLSYPARSLLCLRPQPKGQIVRPGCYYFGVGLLIHAVHNSGVYVRMLLGTLLSLDPQTNCANSLSLTIPGALRIQVWNSTTVEGVQRSDERQSGMRADCGQEMAKQRLLMVSTRAVTLNVLSGGSFAEQRSSRDSKTGAMLWMVWSSSSSSRRGREIRVVSKCV